MEFQKKNILYVDDEFINLELFRLNFKNDYNILTALSAKEGLATLQNNKIDLIISDLKMPIMNGLDFIKNVKSKYPEVKCILLTAFFEEEIKQSVSDTEMVFKFITKPWKRAEMKAILDSTFNE